MINTWNESTLHETLKLHYCGETGKTEVPLRGSICDVQLEDGTIIEIQTKNLHAIRKKLIKLIETHRVILVYPVATNTLIETRSTEGYLEKVRNSPKHGSVYSVFRELTAIPDLLEHEAFSMKVVLCKMAETRVADGTGSWRRKGVRIADRRLVEIIEEHEFSGLEAWQALLPTALPETFTVKDLAEAGIGTHAGEMARVFRKTGILELDGKEGRAFRYRVKK